MSAWQMLTSCPRRLAAVLGVVSMSCAGISAAESWEVATETTLGCLAEVVSPTARSPVPADEVKVKPPAAGAYVGLFTSAGERDYRQFVEKTNYHPPIVFMFHDWLTDADWDSSTPNPRTFHDRLEESSKSPLQLAEEMSQHGTVIFVRLTPSQNMVEPQSQH